MVDWQMKAVVFWSGAYSSRVNLSVRCELWLCGKLISSGRHQLCSRVSDLNHGVLRASLLLLRVCCLTSSLFLISSISSPHFFHFIF